MFGMGRNHTGNAILFAPDINFEIAVMRKDNIAQTFDHIGTLADQSFEFQ